MRGPICGSARVSETYSRPDDFAFEAGLGFADISECVCHGCLLFVSLAVFRGPLVPVDAGPKGRRGTGLNRYGRSTAEHRPGQANLSREEGAPAPGKFVGLAGFGPVSHRPGHTAKDGDKGSSEKRWDIGTGTFGKRIWTQASTSRRAISRAHLDSIALNAARFARNRTRESRPMRGTGQLPRSTNSSTCGQAACGSA